MVIHVNLILGILRNSHVYCGPLCYRVLDLLIGLRDWSLFMAGVGPEEKKVG